MDEPVGPVDASQVPRYAGLSTFARLPRLEDVGRADVAIVGVPFDSSVSYRPGARFGPAHIRQSSRLLRPHNPALRIDPFRVLQVVDAGDIAVNPFSIQQAIAEIESSVRAMDATLLTLGGDHTIALPLLRAAHANHGPLAVLHFDAHLDTWDTYFGEPYTHGTPFRRAAEEGLIDQQHSMHVGIRGPLYDKRDLPEHRRPRLRHDPLRRVRERRRMQRPSGCASGSGTGRSICPSTSTSSTPRTRPAPARRRPAG